MQMPNTSKYLRTDLACESISARRPKEPSEEDGLSYTESEEEGFSVSRLEVFNARGEAEIGRKQGRYTTVFCGNVVYLAESQRSALCDLIGKEVRAFAERATRPIDGDFSALVVGIGNRDITADAVGPRAADNILVTRHIKTASPELYKSLGMCRTSALAPGVLGDTGIETAEIVRAVVKAAKPDVVIAVDALAARACERLSTTIQISDSGIEPGAGIGERRMGISAETVGVPVIAIGVPTVILSSTMVYDVLEKSGITDISETLEETLENGLNFFVSQKECDAVISALASILAESINVSFSLDA